LVLLFGILLEGVIAVAVLAQNKDDTELTAAMPLHPVAGNFKPDGTKLSECTTASCFGQAFGNISYYKGPKVALRLFDEKYGDFSDPGCHQVAHRIGSAALARNHGDIARTFAQGSASCFSGYYHGVLERSLLTVRSYDAVSLGNVVRGLCDGAAMRRTMWLEYQCLHGLGHGLMLTTGYDLPLSLRVCGRLSTSWEQTSCNGGAFMENISTFFGVKSRWVRDDDPVYPCDWVRQDQKLKCYEIVTSRVLRLNGGSWEKASQTCAGVEKGWVAVCFRSLGRDSAGQAHEDPANIRQLCAVARRSGGEADCVEGAARAMVGNFGNARRASALCNTAQPELRGQCWFGIGWVISLYGRTEAKRERDCRAVTSDERHVAECIRGGNAFLKVARTP
jgi:hypothetical protein